MAEEEKIEILIGRKEVCDRLKISKAHIARLFIQYGIKPVEQSKNIFKQKLLYKLNEVEKAFGLKIGGGILHDPKYVVDSFEEVQRKESEDIFEKELNNIIDDDEE